MRPIGSTHTGQPGPWIIFTFGGSRSLQGASTLTMQLVRNPGQFDVIVTTNLFGDMNVINKMFGWKTDGERVRKLAQALRKTLMEICGMEAITLQPAAGAHGELTGILLARAYLQSKGNSRKRILIPDSAHGTNPASSTLCGYDVIQISSNAQGVIDAAAVAQVMAACA